MAGTQNKCARSSRFKKTRVSKSASCAERSDAETDALLLANFEFIGEVSVVSLKEMALGPAAFFMPVGTVKQQPHSVIFFSFRFFFFFFLLLTKNFFFFHFLAVNLPNFPSASHFRLFHEFFHHFLFKSYCLRIPMIKFIFPFFSRRSSRSFVLQKNKKNSKKK